MQLSKVSNLVHLFLVASSVLLQLRKLFLSEASNKESMGHKVNYQLVVIVRQRRMTLQL